MVHVRQRLVAAMVNPSRLSLSFSRYALVGMWRMSSWLLGRLPEGPLDIVGDIHGEIGALAQLLTHLGYGPEEPHGPTEGLYSWEIWSIGGQIVRVWSGWCAD